MAANLDDLTDVAAPGFSPSTASVCRSARAIGEFTGDLATRYWSASSSRRPGGHAVFVGSTLGDVDAVLKISQPLCGWRHIDRPGSIPVWPRRRGIRASTMPAVRGAAYGIGAFSFEVAQFTRRDGLAICGSTPFR